VKPKLPANGNAHVIGIIYMSLTRGAENQGSFNDCIVA
jgi:hypothetical protein